MSFGFSAGDFIAATVLIKDVVQALRGSAAFEYRELILELHGLELALKNIEYLQSPPGQESAVNAVKVAALMCPAAVGREMWWSARRGKRSGMCQCKTKWRNFEPSTEAQQDRRTVEAELLDIKDQLKRHGLHVRESVTSVGTLHALFSGQVFPQLTTLIDLAAKVWTTNMQIIAFLTNFQSSATAIDVKHTWFQEPFKLEDAYGRTIPVPSEYDWGVSPTLSTIPDTSDGA
ncbi:hypothetical protein LTR66_010509 [Elasticomyces elasticus]|nr:hypothetical protein LTR66_010509 [Elasticomyces elasticus]KAK5003105.1 hypothetical protein LTR28_010584 [Elasticomyces elasticus]